MTDLPRAIDAKSAARWAIDLSPGNATVPAQTYPGCLLHSEMVPCPGLRGRILGGARQDCEMRIYHQATRR